MSLTYPFSFVHPAGGNEVVFTAHPPSDDQVAVTWVSSVWRNSMKTVGPHLTITNYGVGSVESYVRCGTWVVVPE